MIDRYRYGNTLRDIVYGYGCCDRDGHLEGGECRHEGGNPLGKVVYGDGDSGNHACLFQFVIGTHLLHTMHLMWVSRFGYKKVYQCDQCDTPEKAQNKVQHPCFFTVDLIK